MSAQQSFFDRILMLNSSKDEAIRRAQNRKIDPTTSVVYHAEDNAPPEGDQKLLDRLVPYFGIYENEEEMISGIDGNHIAFEDHEQNLVRFYNEFGLLDSQSGQGIQTFQSIDAAAKEEMSSRVIDSISQVIAYKNIFK